MAKVDHKKPHYATRDFSDAGTERNFSAGDELKECTEGQIENYAAAGLASTEKLKPETAAPAAPTA